MGSKIQNSKSTERQESRENSITVTVEHNAIYSTLIKDV